MRKVLSALGVTLDPQVAYHNSHFHIYLNPPKAQGITANLLADAPLLGSADSAMPAATLQTEAQVLLDYTDALTNTGDELMFTMDVLDVAAQDAPIVLAQAAAPRAGATPQPDYLLKECQEIESSGDPRSAGRSVDPAYLLKNFLYSYSKGKQIADLATIKTILLEGTAHGKIVSGTTNDNGRTVYRYDVESNYVGDDKAVFMAEFEGKRYKIVVNLVVSLTVSDSPLTSSETPVCPPPQLIKVNGKPVSDSSTYRLNSFTVTFGNLGGRISESIRPRSWKGLPARRNRVREPAQNCAQAHYVNFVSLRTPGGGRSERV